MYSDPIAYFLTWTCYGTWLPGDDRGWTKWHKGDVVAQPLLADWCHDRMHEQPVFLDTTQRSIVMNTISDHCSFRNWHLHAANCRTNHCHVVATSLTHSGEQVRDQLKAWATRRLKEQELQNDANASQRQHWWSRKGSIRYLFDEESLEAAIRYTLEAQEIGGSKVVDQSQRQGASPPVSNKIQ